MLRHVAVGDGVVVQDQSLKLRAQDVPQLCQLVASQIDEGKELELLLALGHEVVVGNLVLLGGQALQVLQVTELVDVLQTILVQVDKPQVVEICELIA